MHSRERSRLRERLGLGTQDLPGSGAVVKNLPAMQEVWVQSLGREDPLEKRIATHSSIVAWRILWTEELGGLQSIGLQKVGHVASVLALCDGWEPWEPLLKCRV